MSMVVAMRPEDRGGSSPLGQMMSMLAGSAGITSRIALSGSPASLLWGKALEWGADTSFYSVNRKRKPAQRDRCVKIIL